MNALDIILTAFNDMVSKDCIHLLWRNKCIRCRKPSVVVHEVIPKSLLPSEWQSWQNQVALCSECHEFAHAVGTVNSKQELRDFQVERLQQYYAPETSRYLIDKLKEWWSKH